MTKYLFDNEFLLKYLYYYKNLDKQAIQKILGLGRKSLDYLLEKYDLVKDCGERDVINFLKRINISDPDICWEWPNTPKNKYGIASFRGKTVSAHRLSAYFFLGFDIDSSFFICHKCDNKSCVNPTHLFVGTCADNVQDMVSKGKQRRGIIINTNKLTEEQVREIKKLYSTERYSWKKLSLMFGVSKSTIGAILKKRNWKWLT